MSKPPANGPNTEPNNHDVLLHVTASGMFALSINKGSKEKEAGARKALMQPLKN
jgi:hypothetical protein